MKQILSTTKIIYTQKITSSIFKIKMHDPIIGSNLILTGLLKILIQESRSFTRVDFDKMYLFKMINDRQYFLIKFGNANNKKLGGIYII